MQTLGVVFTPLNRFSADNKKGIFFYPLTYFSFIKIGGGHLARFPCQKKIVDSTKSFSFFSNKNLVKKKIFVEWTKMCFVQSTKFTYLVK